jgi:hypothetical protein
LVDLASGLLGHESCAGAFAEDVGNDLGTPDSGEFSITWNHDDGELQTYIPLAGDDLMQYNRNGERDSRRRNWTLQ